MNFAVVSAFILWGINIIALFLVSYHLRQSVKTLVKEMQEIKTRLTWSRKRELKLQKEVADHGK